MRISQVFVGIFVVLVRLMLVKRACRALVEGNEEISLGGRYDSLSYRIKRCYPHAIPVELRLCYRYTPHVHP